MQFKKLLKNLEGRGGGIQIVAQLGSHILSLDPLAAPVQSYGEFVHAITLSQVKDLKRNCYGGSPEAVCLMI